MKAKRILVVDDEPPIQRILRRNLIVSGYDVLVAEDGKQALEIIHAHNGRTALLGALAVTIAGAGQCIMTQHFLSPDHTTRRGARASVRTPARNRESSCR